jgi:hypothetical protein
VGANKGTWLDHAKPKELPKRYRPGTEHLWTPLVTTAHKWRQLQLGVFTYEVSEYSDKTNMELIDRWLPFSKRPNGEEED